MRLIPYGEWDESGERWNCAQQAAHIIADPEHWSVDSLRLGDDAVDLDGDPIYGMVAAHRLTPEQLRIALGVPEPSDPSEPHHPDGSQS